MTKSTVISLIQTILSGLAAFLIGKNIFGLPVDQIWITTVVGVIVGLISVIWGFVDHSTTIESFQAGIRNFLSFLGALLLAKGVSGNTIEAISGAVTALLPFLYGILSRQKSAAVTAAINNGPAAANTMAVSLKK